MKTDLDIHACRLWWWLQLLFLLLIISLVFVVDYFRAGQNAEITDCCVSGLSGYGHPDKRRIHISRLQRIRLRRMGNRMGQWI